MKNLQIFIFFLVFLIGGFLGSKLQQKVDLKKEIANTQTDKTRPRFNSTNKNSSLQGSESSANNNSKPTIYLTLPENKKKLPIDTVIEPSIEKLLSGKSYYLKMLITDTGKPKDKKGASRINNLTEMGVADVSKTQIIESNGQKLNVLFRTSSDPEATCNTEIQIITKANGFITKTSDLKNRHIGVINFGVPNALIKLREMHREKIKIASLKVLPKPRQGLKQLENGKIDAYLFRVNIYSDSRVESRLGNFSNGKYTEFPDIKVLETTSYKIPCKIIFLQQSIDKNLEEEIKNNFTAFFSKPENKKLAIKNMGIGNIKPITTEEWTSLKELLRNHGIQHKELIPVMIKN